MVARIINQPSCFTPWCQNMVSMMCVLPVLRLFGCATRDKKGGVFSMQPVKASLHWKHPVCSIRSLSCGAASSMRICSYSSGGVVGRCAWVRAGAMGCIGVWGVVFWGLPSHVYISVVACDLRGTPVSQTSSPPHWCCCVCTASSRGAFVYILSKAPPSTHQCGMSMLKATWVTGCLCNRTCGHAWTLRKSCCCIRRCTVQQAPVVPGMHVARCVWRGVLYGKTHLYEALREALLTIFLYLTELYELYRQLWRGPGIGMM